jgi:hypothetical protein
MRATAPERRRPRLQMGHLLLWVAGCAVVFAQRRSIMRVDLPTAREMVLVFLSSIASGIASGTMLAGCGLLGYRRWRGDTSYPSRAGHWLLLRGLAVFVTSVAFAHSRFPASTFYWSALVIDVAFLWGLRRRLPRYWVAVFLVSSIAAVVRVVGFAAFVHFARQIVTLSLIGIASALPDVVAILWAVGRDRRAGVPTDGLHRVGIGTALALDVILIAFDFVLLVW